MSVSRFALKTYIWNEQANEGMCWMESDSRVNFVKEEKVLIWNIVTVRIELDLGQIQQTGPVSPGYKNHFKRSISENELKYKSFQVCELRIIKSQTIHGGFTVNLGSVLKQTFWKNKIINS